MSTNPPPPNEFPDDDGFSSTPTPGQSAVHRPPHRSASRNSTWSETPAHHHQGTSYFPTSPSYRPGSPPIRRDTSSRMYRGTSTRGARSLRSASVSTTGKGVFDNEDVNADGSDDEEGDTPGAPGATDGAPPAEIAGLGEREFTEEDPLTLKDRQSLMNVEHPFGLPIWKPALYKKSRTVTRDAETEVHSVPKATIDRHFIPGNAFWTIAFGWWLSILTFVIACLVWIIPYGGCEYGRLLFGLAWYILWPFGKYVEGDTEEDEADKVAGDEDIPAPTAATEREPSSLSNSIPRGHSPIPESAHESDTSSGVPLTTHSTISTITPGHTHQQATSWNSSAANERTGLLSRGHVDAYGTTDIDSHPKKAPAGHWLGTVTFYLVFVCILAPILLLVTMICWALVVTIPMAKLNWELLTHLWSRPRNIRFRSAPPPTLVPTPPRPEMSAQPESDTVYTVQRTRLSAGQAAPHPSADPRSTVLLCTYRAVGLRYYKYTVGGVNIMFINLLPVVFFVIFDGFVLLPLAERCEHAGTPLTGILGFLASRAFVFVLSLLSVIPLSYFIGMAVASISAQSSIGMGAVINATFGSIIEIILYGIALTQGKGPLVEGSIVGSLLAGVLLMPGLSMCSGALKKKEQKFNAKSAGVTSTMLIMAIIGVLTPTMFYQVYGNFKLVCDGCPSTSPGVNSADAPWTCTHCYYEHQDPTEDPFYQNTVKEFMYFCAGILLFSYLIGLWFSLRTHASQIWQNPQQLMHPLDIGTVNMPTASGRTSLYNRLAQANLTGTLPIHRLQRKPSQATMTGYPAPISPIATTFNPASVPPNTVNSTTHTRPVSPVQTRSMSVSLPNPMASVAFTPVLESVDHAVKSHGLDKQALPTPLTTDDFTRAVAVATVSALRHQQTHAASPARVRISGAGEQEDAGGHGGHDAPSWSRGVSASVLLSCTFLYAIIAEILVEVVDVVLEGSSIQEKFLGITLFALVPNTTEFMNAISFAIHGNISLSMEIGSAYALQVCLLQIPAMVAFSAWYNSPKENTASEFTLIFPRWDVIAIILSIFLLTYTYIEAKANYHRGSILILSYLVLGAGFYYAPASTEVSHLTTFAPTLSGPSSSTLRTIWTYLAAR
ncbi:hypothetical protein BU17DRAFT_91863 [Hysterangium stoloniferum]|nr:hypothetical protein BU17DRAFT_91863 [Hysterangium stoloniferum]